MKKRIDKSKMAKGYEEMGEINLQISEEFFHLESEGEKFNEVATEKNKGEDKRK